MSKKDRLKAQKEKQDRLRKEEELEEQREREEARERQSRSAKKMMLNGKRVSCESADRMASSMVRARLRTGMMTEASYSKFPFFTSVSTYIGSRRASMAFKYSVNTSSISICASLLWGFT